MADRQVEVVGEVENKLPAEVQNAILIVRKYAADPGKIADLRKRLEEARAQVKSLREQTREADALADKLHDELKLMERHAQMIDKIEGKDEDED